MLAALFDIAILDIITFGRRRAGGQLLLEVRGWLRQAHVRNYALSRYATDRAINHAWPGIFDEHGIGPCRREGNIPHRDSRGRPYGRAEMGAFQVERFDENCVACHVGLLAILERRRREARGGGLIDG